MCGQSITSSMNYSGGQNGWRKVRFFFSSLRAGMSRMGAGEGGSPGGGRSSVVRGGAYV